MSKRFVTAALTVTVLGALAAGCTPTTPDTPDTPSLAAAPVSEPIRVEAVDPPTPVPRPATPDRTALLIVDPLAITPWALDGASDGPPAQLARIGPTGAITYATPGGAPLGLILPTTLSDVSVVPVHEVAHDGEWLRVGLSSRRSLPGEGPVNGATAWIHADDVAALTPITTRVTVNLTTRTLTITEDGVEVFATEVAVGAPATPTPVGTAFLVSRWVEDSSTPQVAALSFHSEVLATFNGGRGVTAIHTYRGATTGAVSNGCIRIPDIAWQEVLALPIGTPITITEV